MSQKLVNIVETFKSWDLKTIEAYKYATFILIALILLGGYWWLGMKRLSMALLMVAIVFLAILLFLEKSKRDKEKPKGKGNKKSKPKDEPVKKWDEVLHEQKKQITEQLQLPRTELSPFA